VAGKLSTIYGRVLRGHVGAGPKAPAGVFLGAVRFLGMQSTTRTLAAVLVHDHS
jgi:hypothetical protein